MKDNKTKLVAVNSITKEELDILKNIYGDLSYDKIIANLIIDFYRNRSNEQR